MNLHDRVHEIKNNRAEAQMQVMDISIILSNNRERTTNIPAAKGYDIREPKILFSSLKIK